MKCDNPECGVEMIGMASGAWRCSRCGNAMWEDQVEEPSRRQRPPLGLVPEFIWKEKRIEELRGAVNRYMDGGYWPLTEWLREMADLIDWSTSRFPRPFMACDGEDPDPTEAKEGRTVKSPVGGPGKVDPERMREAVRSHAEAKARENDISDAAVFGGTAAYWVAKPVAVDSPSGDLVPEGEEFLEGLDEEMSRVESHPVANPHGSRVDDVARPPHGPSFPSGPIPNPRPDIMPKSYPKSPADDGWDEWKELVDRVDQSDFRPYWHKHMGWVVRLPYAHAIRSVGHHADAQSEAYVLAARQLDILKLLQDGEGKA